ncbi:GntR family transcriptional regulator [Bradyrhizobium erythrophlei]|uniref:GntR family transcriptional regulator n=1 Tax=Bradyrhizobium erythrophlei TaxID=1437360 RepID=UPI0035E7B32F
MAQRKKAKTDARRGRSAIAGRRLRLQRTGLHEETTGRLRDLIVRGDLAPGETLVEADLSEALGISRTPLREALKLLASEGLVELRLNRSAMIAPMRQEEIDELFEAVSGIERVAAEHAALRMTERDLEKLDQLQERMERLHDTGKLRDYFELNQQIHSFIVACSRNRALKATHDWLLGRAERARFFALSSQERWDESVQEHRALLAALKARDAERAGRLLAQHVVRTGIVVREILNSKLDGAVRPDDQSAAARSGRATQQEECP